MMRLKFLVFVVPALFYGSIFCQEIPVRLSPLTGIAVNREAMKKYKLFGEQTPDFDSVSFSRNTAGNIFMRIYSTINGSPKESKIPYTPEKLKEKIIRIENNPDEIEEAVKDETALLFDSAGCCYTARVVTLRKDLLPHARNQSLQNVRNYDFSTGVSLNFFRVDFSSVKQFFYDAETALSSPGYKVPHLDVNPDMPVYFNFNLGIKIQDPVWMNLKAGFSSGADSKAWQVSCDLICKYSPGIARTFVPYAGIGLHNYIFRIQKDYGVYIDENYSTLDYIKSCGSQWGFNLIAGSEIIISNTENVGFSADFFLRYSLLGNASAELSYQKTTLKTDVKLRGVMPGAGIKIFF